MIGIINGKGKEKKLLPGRRADCEDLRGSQDGHLSNE